MEEDIENTPQTTEIYEEATYDPDAPKVRIVHEPRRRREDLPRDYHRPPDAALKGVPQFMKFAPDMDPEKMEQIINYLELGIDSEIRDNTEWMNRVLAERATLFDLAFRYYYAGGEADKISDESFKLAMQTGRQSLVTLMSIRNHTLQAKRVKIKEEEHHFTMENRRLKQSEFVRKALAIDRQSRAVDRLFSKKESET